MEHIYQAIAVLIYVIAGVIALAGITNLFSKEKPKNHLPNNVENMLDRKDWIMGKRQFLQDKTKVINVLPIEADVSDELELALQKFPSFPCDPLHAVSVMAEKSGESIKAALQYVYEGGNISDLRKELIQTIAMCMRMILGLDSGDIK